jgi:hypothetical protein
MKTQLRDERGTSVVEAPICIAVVLLIAMGVLTLTQVVWTHMDLASAVRDGTRYAGRVEWDPSANPVTLERHRTAEQIKDFTAKAASESGITTANITVFCELANGDGTFSDRVQCDRVDDPIHPEDLQVGDRVSVVIRDTVDNPLYKTAAGFTNAVSSVFGLDGPFNKDGVDIKAISTTYVE